ncbi:MAG: hypothetical protein KGL39_06820 [Patescibacteria group bacterium]|nr:hypothetical protein [Patescibacteria group bacterium]
MSAYAARTSVSPEKSRAEIESVLKRYGADQFAYALDSEKAIVGFRAKGRRVRFLLPLIPHKAKRPMGARAAQAWEEQAVRSAWRALVLSIKAKLQAVESGIVTFEEEFMAQLVSGSGRTLGEEILPQYQAQIENGKVGPLLLEM